MLVLGDLHIPHRAHSLPAKFKKLLVRRNCLRDVVSFVWSPLPSHATTRARTLIPMMLHTKCMILFACRSCLVLTRVQVPNKIHHIICTGNVCTRETHDYLRTLASDVHITRGDFDDVRSVCIFRVREEVAACNMHW